MKLVSAAVAVLAAACCWLATPVTASAAPITFPLCTEPGPNIWDLGFTVTGTESAFQLSADCPTLRGTMWWPAVRGERLAASHPLGSTLTNLSFTISGGPTAGSGVEARIRVCSFVECGRAVSPDPSGLPVTEELTRADGIPPDPVTMLIELECTKDTCDVQPDTVFENITFTFTDDNPPTVDIYNAWGDLFSGSTLVLDDSGYVYVRSSDADSWNQSMWWTLDDGPENHVDCFSLPDNEPWSSCGIFDGWNGMIRPPDFEGVRNLTVYVSDAAGNVGSTSVMISHDSVPPATPVDLTVGANPEGWINQSDFTARWTNPGSSAGGSDVVRAKYVIRDESDHIVKQGTEDGAGIASLDLFVGSSGGYTLQVSVLDDLGNESDAATVSFRYDWIPPSPPNLAPIPVVNAGFVSSGLTIHWADPTYWDTSFSGLCSYNWVINSLARFDPTEGPGVTTVPVDVTSVELSPTQLAAIPDGVRYFHVAARSCADRDGRAAEAALVIDRHPPRVAVEPDGGGWLATGKALTLRADDSDPDNEYAGVRSITYAVDGGAEQVVTGPKASIFLPQGMHSVEYHAEDIAGNVSAPAVVAAGVDAEAPVAAFGATDPADPARITADVSDVDSGVADAWIEYRSPGSPTWARLLGTSVGGSPRTLSARFPDDESLPSGDYQLRVVSRDRAGNTGITTSRIDGSSASVTLPLRPHPRITLALAAGADKQPSNSLTVPFGKRVFARGTIHEPSGAPIAGASVALSESISGGQRRQFAVVTADSSGVFSSIVPVGASRAVTAEFRGDTLRGSAAVSATFNVRARVTLKRLPKTLRSGKRFYLRGRVDPGLVPLPRFGARVLIQHRSGKRWSGLVAETRTTSDGSFEIPWTQNTRGRSLRMVFRAAVEPEAGWPYATGYSDTRTAVIR